MTKKLDKIVVDFIPEKNEDGKTYKFFDSDNRINTLGRYLYNDGTYSKVTAKNEVNSRVIGSQNDEDYKVVKFLFDGKFNKGVYGNSHTSKGKESIRTGMYGMTGIGGGAYVYWRVGNEVHRQAYYQNMNFPRYIVDEIVCHYDSMNQIHFHAMQENVIVRKVRSDKGKIHNTTGKIIKENEVLSENKRFISIQKKAQKNNK